MNKAFIFDMDGVIIDTERVWPIYEKEFMNTLVGEEIARKLSSTMGLSIELIYEKSKKLGHEGSLEEFIDFYDKYAKIVYKKAELTPGVTDLIKELKIQNFSIGLVSSSPMGWIEMMLERITFASAFSNILSLHKHSELRAKPHPDGYLHMMKLVGASPQQSIILEDSNYGIQSGKKSGAYVIGFKRNLHKNYVQKNADEYADTMKDVIQSVKERFKSEYSL